MEISLRQVIKSIFLTNKNNIFKNYYEMYRYNRFSPDLPIIDISILLSEAPYFNVYLYSKYSELLEGFKEIFLEGQEDLLEITDKEQQELQDYFYPLIIGAPYVYEKPFYLLPNEGPFYSSLEGTVVYISPLKYFPKYTNTICSFCRNINRKNYNVFEIIKDIEDTQKMLLLCEFCKAELDYDANSTLFIPYHKLTVSHEHYIEGELKEELIDVISLRSLSPNIKVGQTLKANGVYEFPPINFNQKKQHLQLWFFCHEFFEVPNIDNVEMSTQRLEDFLSTFRLSINEKIAILSTLNPLSKNPEMNRSRPHILILGTPNSGKTYLLENLNVHKNTTFISSELTTLPGLVGSLSSSFEPGILMKKPEGVLLIDNVENMPRETLRGFYSLMETGMFSLNKAGRKIQFETNTSIIATYTLSKPFNFEMDLLAQVTLPPPFVSRFDFFILLQPNLTNFEESKKNKNIPKILRKEATYRDLIQNNKKLIFELLSTDYNFFNLLKHNTFFGGRIITALYRFLAFYLDMYSLVINSENLKKGLEIFFDLHKPLYFYKEQEVIDSNMSLEVLYTLQTFKLSGKNQSTLQEITIDSLEPYQISMALDDLIKKGLVVRINGSYELSSE